MNLMSLNVIFRFSLFEFQSVIIFTISNKADVSNKTGWLERHNAIHYGEIKMANFRLKIAETQNCETACNENDICTCAPSYTSEVTTSTYQIGNSLSTVVNLKVDVLLNETLNYGYLNEVMDAWLDFRHELDSIGEFYAEEADDDFDEFEDDEYIDESSFEYDYDFDA